MQRRDVVTEEKQERGRYDVDLLRSEGDVDGLTDALDSPDALIRQRAAQALGILGDPAAVDPLIGVLGDPVVGVREAAADSLVMVGNLAVEPLIQVLEGSWWAERYEWAGEAREGMAQHDMLGGPADVEPEDKESLRRESLPQHDMYAGPGDIGPKKGLRKGDMTQQDLLGGPADVDQKAKAEFRREPLPQHQMYGGPTDVGSRKSLRHGDLAQHDLLGGPEDVRGHEALHTRETLRGEGPPGTWDVRTRRIHAAAILGEIGDTRALDALRQLTQNADSEVRSVAEDAIGKIQARSGAMQTPPPPTSR